MHINRARSISARGRKKRINNNRVAGDTDLTGRLARCSVFRDPCIFPGVSFSPLFMLSPRSRQLTGIAVKITFTSAIARHATVQSFNLSNGSRISEKSSISESRYFMRFFHPRSLVTARSFGKVGLVRGCFPTFDVENGEPRGLGESISTRPLLAKTRGESSRWNNPKLRYYREGPGQLHGSRQQKSRLPQTSSKILRSGVQRLKAEPLTRKSARDGRRENRNLGA